MTSTTTTRHRQGGQCWGEEEVAEANVPALSGSAALPVTMAIGLEQGVIKSGDKVAMLGIGSGINSVMLAAEWQ